MARGCKTACAPCGNLADCWAAADAELDVAAPEEADSYGWQADEAAEREAGRFERWAG